MKKRSLLPTVLCAAVSLVFLTGCGNNPKAAETSCGKLSSQ